MPKAAEHTPSPSVFLTRRALKTMLAWKQAPRRSALCVTGARQTGKTTLIRHFGLQQYEHLIELNFLTDPRAKAVFAGPLDAESVITQLSAYLRRPLIPGKTLIFLDEIQECPQARTAIKFLVEDGRFDYIESGSLLGVRTRNVPSFPVGFETPITMYPIDFEEFCVACGLQEETLSYLKECFDRTEPVLDAVHQTLNALFYAYLVVGGMPQCVRTYLATHDMGEVLAVQKDILALYRLDITRYSDLQKDKIREIFDALPSQLENKNRRFFLSDLAKSARMERYESAFIWLSDAGVALPCFNVSAPTVPLTLSEKRNLFKLFLCDTGLLACASMQNIQLDILQGNVSVNLGSILENFFAQQLVTNGFALRYYHSKRLGEVDFAVQKGREVIPIEIKSGRDYRRHQALNNVLSVPDWGLKQGIVFCRGNVEKVGAVTYLPWYMVPFFVPDPAASGKMPVVDLSSLRNTL